MTTISQITQEISWSLINSENAVDQVVSYQDSTVSKMLAAVESDEYINAGLTAVDMQSLIDAHDGAIKQAAQDLQNLLFGFHVAATELADAKGVERDKGWRKNGGGGKRSETVV